MPRSKWTYFKFYIKLWLVIGHKFHQMILAFINSQSLSQGMNKRMIVLLHKSGPTNKLSNYKPIVLLNILCKILAKVLQLLQDLIDEDQTTFLPIRYILDNIFMQTKIVEWCKFLQRELILLKFDFKKANDIVNLYFLF